MCPPVLHHSRTDIFTDARPGKVPLYPALSSGRGSRRRRMPPNFLVEMGRSQEASQPAQFCRLYRPELRGARQVRPERGGGEEAGCAGARYSRLGLIILHQTLAEALGRLGNKDGVERLEALLAPGSGEEQGRFAAMLARLGNDIGYPQAIQLSISVKAEERAASIEALYAFISLFGDSSERSG